MFDHCQNLQELKQEYRKAAMKFHPDRGGSDEQMKKVNAAYDEAKARLSKQEARQQPQSAKSYTDYEKEADDFREALLAVLGLPDIEIEVCGSWIWIRNLAFELAKADRSKKAQCLLNNDALKQAGYSFAPKKEMWHWPKTSYSRRKQRLSMDEIRDKYGSDKIKQSGSARLSA